MKRHKKQWRRKRDAIKNLSRTEMNENFGILSRVRGNFEQSPIPLSPRFDLDLDLEESDERDSCIISSSHRGGFNYCLEVEFGAQNVEAGVVDDAGVYEGELETELVDNRPL